MRTFILASLLASSCASAGKWPPAAAPGSTLVHLDGGDAGGVFMDYLAYDAREDLVWVPAGNSGSVYVIAPRRADGQSASPLKYLNRIAGFPTATVERNGRKRVVGPSSVTLGDKVVYIGNRADFTVCGVPSVDKGRGECGKLDSSPDGIAWVAATGEVWVTTPRDKSLRLLDGASLNQKDRIALDGEPEGYAVDATRGLFYTNLEDGDRTLAIDVHTHAVRSTWKPGCGPAGPRGLALDEAAGVLFVACTTRVVALDVAHGGAVISSIDTGEGLDNIDYAPATRRLYAAAGKAAQLTIAAADATGHLALVQRIPTRPGARNAVVDRNGLVYIAHSPGAEVLVVKPADAPLTH